MYRNLAEFTPRWTEVMPTSTAPSQPPPPPPPKTRPNPLHRPLPTMNQPSPLRTTPTPHQPLSTASSLTRDQHPPTTARTVLAPHPQGSHPAHPLPAPQSSVAHAWCRPRQTAKSGPKAKLARHVNNLFDESSHPKPSPKPLDLHVPFPRTFAASCSVYSASALVSKGEQMAAPTPH